MKNILISLLFIFSVEAFAQNAPQGVVDYFRLLPEEIRTFSLRQKAGKWVSLSPSTEEEVLTVVDTKNGFIRITDEGTGGGTHEVTVVLYRKANKEAVIAVSERTHDGTMETFKIDFFEYKNKQWNKLTNVMPPLNHVSFLKEQIDTKAHQALLDRSPIIIDLPQFGTKAKAVVGTMWLNLVCNQMKDDPDSPNACALQNKFYESIELLWDKEQGKFSMGTKK
jgi:hypothetical protein